MNASQILTGDEIRYTVDDLKRKGKYSWNARINLIIFRLSCCCGLRRCEISGLVLRDIILSAERPQIKIRKEITKGRERERKTRLVPLWWDSETMRDIRAWVEQRRAETGDGTSPVVFAPKSGEPLSPRLISLRWRTAIKCLGKERREQVPCHAGRHSFVSHALHRGRSLAEVRDAVGHGSIDTTSIYAHALSNESVGDIFAPPVVVVPEVIYREPETREVIIRWGRRINLKGEEV